MTKAVMNKSMTFFRDVEGGTEVFSGDTIEEAGNLMRSAFDGPVHEVTFKLLDHPDAPSLDVQLRNRVRKLKQIAKVAGRIVSRIDRDGICVTALVSR